MLSAKLIQLLAYSKYTLCNDYPSQKIAKDDANGCTTFGSYTCNQKNATMMLCCKT